MSVVVLHETLRVTTGGAPGARDESLPPPPAGDTLTCPNCGRCAPTWQWRPLALPDAHRGRLVPVYRCPVPGCRYLFAPLPPELRR